MRQNQFTLSAASRNLKVDQIWSLTEEEAYQVVKTVRFADTLGRPVCPYCGNDHIQIYKKRRIFKCGPCKRQFSVTSGTIWARRKMSFRRILLLTAYFVMNANGKASSRLGREINLSPLSAFVGAHKMREAMASADSDTILSGIVEVDGCIVGGHVRKANKAIDRKRLGNRSNKAKQAVICAARERGGRILTAIRPHEKDFVPFVRARVRHDAVLQTDQGSHWERLGETFPVVHVINHSEQYWSPVANTNTVESFFARVRRGQRGVYLKIADAHRDLYAIEQAWRATNCRVSDAERYLQLLRLCLTHPISRRFSGYWHRGRKR